MKNRTSCNQGHELTPENTYITKAGYRECRTCHRVYERGARNKQFFDGNREKVIQRDGEKCLKCGMTRVEHQAKYGLDITVDHIDNMGVYVPKALRNSSMDNLQTLCLACHMRKDNRFYKLTDNQVINIHHMKGALSQRKIAKLYGVSQRHISYIHRGEWRKNLTPAALNGGNV